MESEFRKFIMASSPFNFQANPSKKSKKALKKLLAELPSFEHVVYKSLKMSSSFAVQVHTSSTVNINMEASRNKRIRLFMDSVFRSPAGQDPAMM